MYWVLFLVIWRFDYSGGHWSWNGPEKKWHTCMDFVKDTCKTSCEMKVYNAAIFFAIFSTIITTIMSSSKELRFSCQ